MRNFVFAAVVLGSAGAASAAEDGKVVLARGTVTVRNNAGPRQATPGMVLSEGDQVQTGADGTIRLLVSGNAVVDLSNNTSMVVTRASQTEKTRIKVWSGRLWARVSKLFGSSEFEVESPNAVAGVRGTEFIVDVAPDGSTDINVLDGSVAVWNRDGGPQQLLGIGDRLSAQTGKETSTGKSSETDRRSLRSSSNAGSRLNAAAAARFATIAPHLNPNAQGRTAPRIGDRLPVPPLDIDPAAGRIRLRGRLNIVD